MLELVPVHVRELEPEARRDPEAGLEVELDEACRRVLRMPAVADKSFLIHIGDRTVGGLVAQDQLVVGRVQSFFLGNRACNSQMEVMLSSILK